MPKERNAPLEELSTVDAVDRDEETVAAKVAHLLLWLSKPEDGEDLLEAVRNTERRPLSPGEAGLVLNAIADGLESVLKAHDDEIDDPEAQLAVDGDEE